MTILDDILEHKRGEVAQAKLHRDSDKLARSAADVTIAPRGFREALVKKEGVAVIAEIKRRSPSKGMIREDFDPVKIARAYADAGAACISVLTDSHFFGGSLEILETVRTAVETPILRKDFVVDRDQISEARLAGADAILLIVSALEQHDLESLHGYARRLGLDVLVEVHDEAEFARALAIETNLIGVNHRDLKTFEVDLGTTARIAEQMPAGRDILLVAESGIRSSEDIEQLTSAGAGAFLVGESLMRESDPGQALRLLREQNP